MIPDHDILLGGFPCQPFSIIGDKKGFSDTRGTLFFEIERILRDKKPYAFMLENVKQLLSHDDGRTFAVIKAALEGLGYYVHYKVLNSLDYGLPQKRERIIIVGFRENITFRFPLPSQNRLSLEDVLESDKKVDASLFASKEIQKKRLEKLKIKPFYPSIWHENKGGNISALPYSCALRAGASYNYLLVNGKRRLSAREMLRLQGFPESFKVVVSNMQIRKQLGNSVSVPVMRAVASEMLSAIRKKVPFVAEESKQLLLAM